MLRIPGRVTFPFGYTVKVQQVTDAVMDQIAADCDGVWDVETRTITLRKSLPSRRKAYILTHELQHALLDLTHTFLDSGEAKP